jgi:pimeloyl-ACP methyl ester carboxylesterase
MQTSQIAVEIEVDGGVLSGDLNVPKGAARGVILFAHGSGSSRLSPRNQYVAAELNKARFATLLMDLLTSREEILDQVSRHIRFDIPLLAGRLTAAIDWLEKTDETRDLYVGLFGASTGSAAAIISASERPNSVAAVVSRGGRPDLADAFLSRLQAATLMIVGGADSTVLDLNAKAMKRMKCDCRLEIIPDATHLFEEVGALEEVAGLARQWFLHYMGPPAAQTQSEFAPVR